MTNFKTQVFLRLGSMAAFICSIASTMSIAAVWWTQWDITTISYLIYALSLVVIPFALWHRIEDAQRKWKACICNVLTSATALFIIVTDVQLIRENLPAQINSDVLGVLLLATSALCMTYMAWALWDGGATWLGFGAVLLAGLTLGHGWLFELAGGTRILWFLCLSYWFLRPLQHVLH